MKLASRVSLCSLARKFRRNGTLECSSPGRRDPGVKQRRISAARVAASPERGSHSAHFQSIVKSFTLEHWAQAGRSGGCTGRSARLNAACRNGASARKDYFF